MSRPLTPALSPSDGERVSEGRVRGIRGRSRSQGAILGLWKLRTGVTELLPGAVGYAVLKACCRDRCSRGQQHGSGLAAIQRWVVGSGFHSPKGGSP